MNLFFNSRRCLLLVLACMLTLSFAFSQKRSYTNHYIALWANGGGSSLITNQADITSSLGLGYGLGLGYEFQYKKFILQTGAEFTQLNPIFEKDAFDAPPRPGLVDDENFVYTGIWTFSENVDRMRLGYINFPLLFGFKFNKVYFLTGGRVGLNMTGTSSVETNVEVKGIYNDLEGVYENMPNHSFYKYKEAEAYPLNLALDASVHAEVGYYLGNSEKKTISYRLAAFYDYGILNINNNPQESFILNRNKTGLFQPYLNSYMRSSNMIANTSYTGLKFTVLFKLPKKHICICEQY